VDPNVMEIDAFLADSVVAAENKLYVQGAGWDSIYSAVFPARHPRVGVGILLRIPWTATNEMHTFSIRVEDADGQNLMLAAPPPGVQVPGGKIYDIRGQFNIGRPSLLGQGDSQIVPIALNLDGLEFPQPNTFNVVVEVDNKEMRRLPFHVRGMVQIPQSPSVAMPGA
jgi:hypothetical protein